MIHTSVESLYAQLEAQQRIIKQADEDRKRLIAERDAALAEVKTLSKNIGEFADRTTNEIRGLRSALREAKEDLAAYYRTGMPEYYEDAIATINKVLGEE